MTRSARFLGALVVFFVLGAPGAAGDDPPDAPGPPSTFEHALAQRGLSRGDLAVETFPDGLGHPVTSRVPFVLPWTESFREDPTRVPALGGNLLHVAERAAGDAPPPSGRLPLLLTAFGLQPRFPESFRGYGVPQPPLPHEPGVLTAVLQRLRNRASFDPWLPVDHHRRPISAPLPEPSPEETRLPPDLPLPLARLLGAVVDAGEAVDRSWRGVDENALSRAVEADDVPLLLPGGTVFWPALEHAAERGDDRERGRGALRLLTALERSLGDLRQISWSGFVGAQWETPWGRVILGTEGDDVYSCRQDCLLILDPGGNDVYRGTAAAAVGPSRPVAVVIDLAGRDRYEAGSVRAAQGAGLGGLGVLVDLAGDDVYQAADQAQGFGLLGYGVLADWGGRDRYRAAGGAQGSAVFGAGLLVDGGGGDDYKILGEGQGFGGPWGAGALVDLGGDDRYFAEPDPSIARGRADYHSEGRVAANNAQGAGVGRRGDLTDGHAWAGGVGALVDLRGDDVYEAGNFAQGLGYWYGTGLLLDGEGDDLYRSVYFTQGSGAHFSLALLYDRSGADRHVLEQEAGASLGYGWDFAVSWFLDGGREADVYRAKKTALGSADRSSVAVFVDAGGDDLYDLPANGPRLRGATDGHPAWPDESTGPVRAGAVVEPVGVFLDLEWNGRRGALPRWVLRAPPS